MTAKEAGMKYYKLLTDNSLFYSGNAIFTEPLMKRLLRELSENEATIQKFEEVSEEYVKANSYYMIYCSDFSGNCGERNIFHDVNGNEYHN